MIYAQARYIRLNGKTYAERACVKPEYYKEGDLRHHPTKRSRHCYRLTCNGQVSERSYWEEANESRTKVVNTMPAGWQEPYVPERPRYEDGFDVDSLELAPVAADTVLFVLTTNSGQALWLDFSAEPGLKLPILQTRPGLWGAYGLPGGLLANSGSQGDLKELTQHKLGLNLLPLGAPDALLYDNVRGSDVRVYRLAGDYLAQVVEAAETRLDGLWTVLAHTRCGQWASAGRLKALYEGHALEPLTRRVFDTRQDWWPGWEADADDEAALQEAS